MNVQSSLKWLSNTFSRNINSTINEPIQNIFSDLKTLFDNVSTLVSGSIGGVTISNGGIMSSGFFVGLIPDSAEQVLVGPGAVNISAYSTKLTTTGVDAYTLADGSVNGQLKEITGDSDAGDGTLTPATASGFTTITFDDGKVDNVLLIWNAKEPGWRVIRNNGATVA